MDPPGVFQSISPVRHADKLKQAHFNRAQKEDGGGFARHTRAASPRPLSFAVEMGKASAFPAPDVGIFSPSVKPGPGEVGKVTPWWQRGDGELPDGARSKGGDFAADVN